MKLKHFIIPSLLVLISLFVTWKWEGLQPQLTNGAEMNAFMTIFPILPYLIFIITISLGLRSNRSDLVFVSLILVFSYYALQRENETLFIQKYLAFLIPLNFAVYSNLQKKLIFSKTGFFMLVFLGLEIGFFSFLIHFTGNSILTYTLDLQEVFPQTAEKLTDWNLYLFSFFTEHIFLGINLPLFLSFLLAALILFIRYLQTGNIILPAYLIVMSSVLLAMICEKNDPAYMVFFSSSGIILIVNSFERSLNLAYIDELTNLPGRRSMEETLHNLGKNFTIAMIDIDHFKKFNDTYGHKTGDEVLKMVAAHLEKISGGAKVFRYGGEEFTAVFSNKDALQTKAFMESYHKNIETADFMVRGKSRKRNSEKKRGKTGDNKQKKVKVTVSIGIATSTKAEHDPHKILKLADKALYKAKKQGRNQVCLNK